MSAKPLIVPSLIISVTLIVMSGACSAHEPGSYEGGGRNTTAPQLSGTTTQEAGDDSGFDFDAFDFDSFTFDAGGGQG
ncbi:MAG TPA: hypothetical protein VGH28_14515 [Polyangiaceae bacterium]|jgi:hypothetical protein